MIFIWGKKGRDDLRGCVADQCPACRQPTAFELTNHYSVDHIYYIPLGKGKLVASSRRCLKCGSVFDANPHEYSGVARPGSTRDLDQLIPLTNPRLSQVISERRQLEALAQAEAAQLPPALPEGGESALAVPPGSARLRLAAKKLEGTDDSEAKSELVGRLGQWAQLDESNRQALVVEVDEFVTEQEKVQRTVLFIRMISVSFNGLAGCLPGLFGLGLTAAPFIFFPPVRSWLWGPLVVVAGLVLAFTFFIKASNASVQRWADKTLIPQLERDQIDPGYFIGILASAKGEKGLGEKLKDLVSNVEAVEAALIRRGVLGLER